MLENVGVWCRSRLQMLENVGVWCRSRLQMLENVEVWCRSRLQMFVGDPVIKRGGLVGSPLTGLTPPHCCACPKLGPRFPTSYVLVLYCVQLRWEVIVRFVDIDVICDHHCLNFLFLSFLTAIVYHATHRRYPTADHAPIALHSSPMGQLAEISSVR
jgi:hypothetical protein